MPTLGQDAGIFKKHGLTLDNFGTAGAGETIQPIIAGAADIGIGVGVAGVMRVFSKGAPVRVLLPAFTGTGDLYWYVRADSPLKSLKDTTEKNTIAYSTQGSSSNNLVVAFKDEMGVKAKAVATGTPAATITAVMSGQVDIGWGAFPIGLKDADEGKIRIIARGSDLTDLDKQTVRVVIVNADTLKNKHDAVMRFVQAYRETVDWMYSNPDAIKRYAAKVEQRTKRSCSAVDREDRYPEVRACRPTRSRSQPPGDFDAQERPRTSASRFYDVTYWVEPGLAAIARNRMVTALALGYALDAGPDLGLDFGLDRAFLAGPTSGLQRPLWRSAAATARRARFGRRNIGSRPARY